ncbi:MAG TPA: LLM class flavin-dependent oxidoreductase [Verrucomicrobiae bacterium]|jgi:alkanesulfonate monooxygenase SsuD/methylene tetrahydromethanopterin reductase-like flavin-dependent oxidoreductase (luciferase family)|nr:LLM class flavin-dependent oxidoreductase [Verrucomicrobiae bacterium]
MKIGVLLPGCFTDSGDYLADARALDAAGVDSLWLADDVFDPWMVLSGIAAVTGRTRLAAPVSDLEGAAPDALGRRMATLERLSRGRLLATVTAAARPADTERLIACARRAGPAPLLLQGGGQGQSLLGARLADGLVAVVDEPKQCHAAFDHARERRTRDARTAPFELWTRVPAPDGREAWRALREAAEAVGATGIIVPADPRLLDLLRNGDEEEDRSDLGLSQG